MSMTLGEAFIKLGFDVSDAGLKDFQNGIDKLENAMFKLSAGSGAALYGIDTMLHNVSDGALKMRDFAYQTGLSQEALQQWAIAANLANPLLSVDEAENDIANLEKSIENIRVSGDSAAAGALSKLGVSDLNNKNAFQVLEAIRPKIKAIADQFGAGVASTWLQNAGIDPKFLELLRSNDTTFNAYMKRSSKMALSDSELKGLTAVGDSVNDLEKKFDSLKLHIAAAFAPETLKILNNIPEVLGNIARTAVAMKVPLEGLGVAMLAFTVQLSPLLAIAAALTSILAIMDKLGEKSVTGNGTRLDDFLNHSPISSDMNQSFREWFSNTFRGNLLPPDNYDYSELDKYRKKDFFPPSYLMTPQGIQNQQMSNISFGDTNFTLHANQIQEGTEDMLAGREKYLRNNISRVFDLNNNTGQ